MTKGFSLIAIQLAIDRVEKRNRLNVAITPHDLRSRSAR